MTKDKWFLLRYWEISKWFEKITNCYSKDSIDTWLEEREVLLHFIKEMDKATEVYFMENNKKVGE
jgi:hypothetical protein